MKLTRRKFAAGASFTMGIALSPTSAIAGVLRDGREPTTKAEFDALMSRFVDSRVGSFTCIRTLDSADGPFYYERSEMRRSIAEDRSGMALRLGINVGQIFLRADMCAPLSGAVVDLWLADGAGQYSNVGGDLQNENTVGKTFLRGHQITDANGNVEFDVVVPGWELVGAPPPINVVRRPPHIHVKVFHEHKVLTTQLYFADQFMDQLYAEVEPYKANESMTCPGVEVSQRRILNGGDPLFELDHSQPLSPVREGSRVAAIAKIGVVTLGSQGFAPYLR